MGWQVVLAIAAIAEGKARRDLTAKSKSFVHWSYDLRHPDNAIGIGHYYLAVAKSTMRSRTKVTSTKYLILASPFASEVASKWQTKFTLARQICADNQSRSRRDSNPQPSDP